MESLHWNTLVSFLRHCLSDFDVDASGTIRRSFADTLVFLL